MKLNKKVSIIVPIYNTEKFLDKCISSIVNQTYKNIELILINNNSSGNAEEICLKYQKKDKRIIYKNTSKQGVSFARNEGLNLSTGDYICFIDSDDYIEKDYVETLLTNVVKSNADVVECGYNRVNESGEILYEKKQKEYSESDSYKISKSFLELIYFENMLWNKIFKKEILDNIRFKPFHTSEDYEFLTNVYLKTSKKVNIDKILYNYLDNSNSICNSEFSRSKLDVIYARIESFNLYKSLNYEYLYNYVALRIVFFVFEFYSKTNDKSIRKELKEIFNNYYKYALKSNVKMGGFKIDLKTKLYRKIGYFAFKCFPNLFIKIKNK